MAVAWFSTSARAAHIARGGGAGNGFRDAFNAYSEKVRSKSVTPDAEARAFAVLEHQLATEHKELVASIEATKAVVQRQMQAKIDELATELNAANSSRRVWALAAFCAGIAPTALRFVDWI
jgi:hypothetical protein